MATFVTDTFTDTAGDDLAAAHTGETGATWAEHPNFTSGAVVISDANRIRPSAVIAALYASGTPATAEYGVNADIRRITAVGRPAIVGRLDTSASTWYYVIYRTATTLWELGKVVAGTPSVLGTFTQALADATTYAVRLELRDAAKKVFIDGVERISSTDNAITAAGRAGVYWEGAAGTNATGYHIDNFVAADVPTVPLATAAAGSGATLALGAATQVALGASSAAAGPTLALSATTQVPLGSSNATASASLTLSATTVVPLDAAAAVCTNSLALSAQTQIALAPSSAAAATSLALGAQTVIFLGAASGASSATLALAAVALVGTGSANGASSASLALSAATQIPLDASSATSSGTVAFTAATTIVLGPSGALAVGALALSATTVVPLNGSTASAGASLAITAPTVVALGVAGASSTATLAASVPTQVVLDASATLSSATLAVAAATAVALSASDAAASSTLALGAQTQVPLGAAAAVATGSLAFTAGFTPATITGLELWLKADAITGKVDGDAVSQWDDSSGHGNHGAQATGTKQPLYKTSVVNGLPVLRFDGTDDFLAVTGILSDDPTRTIFVVAKSTDTGAARRVWGFGSGAAGVFDNGGQWSYYPNQAGGVTALGGDSRSAFSYLTVRFVSTASAVGYSDSGAGTAFDPDDLYQNEGGTLGVGSSRYGDNNHKGDIAEVLVYDSALSDADRDAVTNYLIAKYGLAAPAAVPMGAAVATASATLSVKAPTAVPLAASSGISIATVALTAPTLVAFDAAAAVSSATLALTAPTIVSLGSSSASSTAALSLGAQNQVPLQASGATANAALAFTAPTQVLLGTAASTLNATLVLGALTGLAFTPVMVTSSGALVITAVGVDRPARPAGPQTPAGAFGQPLTPTVPFRQPETARF